MTYCLQRSSKHHASSNIRTSLQRFFCLCKRVSNYIRNSPTRKSFGRLREDAREVAPNIFVRVPILEGNLSLFSNQYCVALWAVAYSNASPLGVAGAIRVAPKPLSVSALDCCNLRSASRAIHNECCLGFVLSRCHYPNNSQVSLTNMSSGVIRSFTMPCA